MRCLKQAVRGALAVGALWCLAAATPLDAQQTADSANAVADSLPQAGDTVVSTTTVPADQRGPRLQPQWRHAEPAFAERPASGSTTAVADTHTFTFTTLALILLVVVLVLVIAR